MSHWLVGRVERNEPGAQYEDKVYDRILRLRLRGGVEITVTDIGPPLANDLEVGSTYEIVVMALIFVDLVIGVAPTDTSRPWVADLVETSWRPTRSGFRTLRPALLEGDWTVLETAAGRMITTRSELGLTREPVRKVAWSTCQFDLYAIL